MGENNVEPLRANIEMHRALGVPVDLVDADACPRAVAGIHLDDFAGFAYEPLGGHGDAYMTGMAYGARARALGVRIRQSTNVVRLISDDFGAVRGVLCADGTEILCDTVVLATGVWSPALAATAGVHLPIRPSASNCCWWIRCAPPTSRLLGSGELAVHPTRTQRSPTGRQQRSLESRDRRSDAHPNALPRTSSRPRSETRPHPARHAGSATRVVVRGLLRHHSRLQPDHRPSPAAGLFLAVGFSGHGFKISPAWGVWRPDLLLDGISSDPAVDGNDFRYSRFGEGKPLVSLHPYAGAGEMR